MATISRRSLAQYYTPQWLAQQMVNWALPGSGTLLDPSFGGCAFLEAALRKSQLSPISERARSIYGVDVDKAALRHATTLFHQGVPEANIIIDNFLTTSVFERLGKFSAVVGNPPYIRHQELSDRLIDEAQNVTEPFAKLSRRSSAWAYFSILATELVEVGGRLAFVLPGSLLHASYGKTISRFISERFKTVNLLHVAERLFDDTDEESIIVLADSRVTRGASMLEYRRLSALQLPAFFSEYEAPKKSSGEYYKLTLIDPSIMEARDHVRKRLSCVDFEEVAEVRIGIVTGANEFFLRNATDPILRLRDVRSKNILSRRRQLDLPVLARHHMSRYNDSAAATKLAIIDGPGRAGSGLRNELNVAERQGISGRFHCAKRAPWYTITDLSVADCFLPYLNGSSPHLVKNAARALCTNTVHRINFKDTKAIDAAVAYSYSALFAFECELFGRHYGGSVLKVEPSSVKKLSLNLDLEILADIVKLKTENQRRSFVDTEVAKRFGINVKLLLRLRDGAGMLKDHRMASRFALPNS